MPKSKYFHPSEIVRQYLNRQKSKWEKKRRDHIMAPSYVYFLDSLLREVEWGV
jgi:hypothetical protein